VRGVFSVGGDRIEGRFVFENDGTVHIQPLSRMKGLLISGDISFGIIPSPPLDDLIYDPKRYPSPDRLHLPSENLFMGLLKGEDRLFYCAWPSNDQKLRLVLEGEGESRRIVAVEVILSEEGIYLKGVNVPGIWHEEETDPSYLERDVQLNWRIPFKARWETRLFEGGIETTFPFRREGEWGYKGRIWRPVVGWYTYPVWIEGDIGFIHLSKKITAPEKILIYAVEGSEGTILEFAEKHLGTIPSLTRKVELQRYPEDNVGLRNCDGRAWVKWTFRVGLQSREREFLLQALDDFLYSINVDKTRLEEYEDFIPKLKDRMKKWLEESRGKPELGGFLKELLGKLEEIERIYWEIMDNSPPAEHLRHEIEAINGIKPLLNEMGTEAYPKACYLLDEIQLWSLIESVPGRVGGLLRELSLQAGYSCARNPEAVGYAQIIRKEIREFLIRAETHETIY